MIDILKLKNLSENYNVLYVEDDEDSRKPVYKILNILFAEVEMAYNGLDALNIYKKNLNIKPFNIVITDLSLSELNGVSLIREIKKLNPEQAIIVISAHEQAEIFLDVIESGVDSYILKPLDSEKFFESIEKCIKNIENKKLSKAYKKTLEIQLEQQNKFIDNILNLDELTGLENENSFLSFINQREDFFTLSLVKIDNLADIKNLTGKEYCNFYLKELARLITDFFENSGKSVKIYRIDFDELAIILDETLDRAKKIAEELNALAKYFFCEKDGISLNSTFTIGLYYGNSDIYSKAKCVLSDAEQNAKGHCIASSATTLQNENVPKNIYWLKKFSESIENDMLIPYFQPIFDNRLNKITKYECLVRIEDQSGIIEPSRFLNLASKIRQTPFLTKIMIRKALEYFHTKPSDIEFSINLSMHDLQDDTLFRHIEYWIDKYPIETDRIIFEILENEDIYQNNNVKQTLKSLKKKGFKLAIDDFGTGYSNFIYLHEFSVDYIKIDGSFIRNLDCDKSLHDFVSYIDKLIKLSGAKSVAEFVANDNIQSIVKDIGIDFSQGYAIGKPQKEIIQCTTSLK